jgi:citrate lyase subunit beta/citryl-CoA lyase
LRSAGVDAQKTRILTGETTMKLRSPLFAPGDSARKIEKALAGPADAVILDLEDSVASGQKDAARALTAEIAAASQRPGLIVRINPPGTQWYLADLAAIVKARPDAVMLPKCGSAADLLALDHHLEALEVAADIEPGSIRVMPIVTETTASVLALPTMLIGTTRVIAVCFGAEDLSADLGISPRRADGTYPAAIAAARAQTLLAAAAAGIPAIDTPFPDPRNPDGLAREAAEAAVDGFAGKLCIHPDQIGPVNHAFTPSPELRAWAERVLAGFAANPGAGVFSLDGKMIDRPHLRLAERLLASAD